ncbi:MAG: prepilin-type N-terminal cleavage/methylation domain-containing protein [Planctomycetota bacterium]|nr:prepilin-type N-terminal cleavage/methylation domain-containing protein [Planctomycetota bacterium]
MNRRGFSLLEVLVALSLSLLLLGAIYAGLDLFWRFSTTGQEEVERAQIARAVIRQIEVDLRSVVFKDPSSGSTGSTGASGGSSGSTGSSSGPASTPFTSTTGPTSTPTTPTSGGTSTGSSTGSTGTSGSPGATDSTGTTTGTVAPTPVGLVGTATTLKITTCSPSRRNEFVPFGTQVAGVSRSSDMLQVAYQLGDPTMTTGLPTGLARMEGDSMLLSQPQNAANTQLLAASTQMVANEVTSLSFSYFDGYNWRVDWDSATLGGLPTAVEVIVEITTPPRGTRPGVSASSRSSKTQSFRVVVAIPLAKATDTSTIQ